MAAVAVNALMGVHPYCPQCGNYVLFEAPRADMEKEPLKPFPVVCEQCHWRGEAPLCIPLPLR